MNRKHIDPHVETEQQQNGQYAVAHNRKADIIAAVVCLLLAVLVWLVFMNRTETDYVELVVAEPAEGYRYELSVTQIEIEGGVTDLRNVTEIKVKLPAVAAATEGVYQLDESALMLPDGVVFAKSLNLTVTVTKVG